MVYMMSTRAIEVRTIRIYYVPGITQNCQITALLRHYGEVTLAELHVIIGLGRRNYVTPPAPNYNNATHSNINPCIISAVSAPGMHVLPRDYGHSLGQLR